MALSRRTEVLTLHGMEALQRALTDNLALVRDLAADAVSVTTFAIAQAARAQVPRQSGLLARSITARMRGLTGRVEVQVDAFYWHFLEYGTVKLGARPVFRTAAEMESANFERRIQDIARRLEQRFSQARAA